LKLGGYGLVRFCFILLPFGAFYMLPVIQTLSLMGTIFGALTALRQIDIKKIIAYSSVSHMNLGVLGLCTFSLQG
jgi:NADH:ubiquinone oxidoreductase subunit 4 (subunit M)